MPKLTLKYAGNPATPKAINWVMQRIKVSTSEAHTLLCISTKDEIANIIADRGNPAIQSHPSVPRQS